jgi:hypothetical protein
MAQAADSLDALLALDQQSRSAARQVVQRLGH